jgi:hypothetical protein
MMIPTIQVNDTVHARYYDAERGNAAIQDFIVTTIEGNTYLGGAIPCDVGAGWELEITAKTLENLALPSTLSEITAYDYRKTPIHLMGKGEVWVDSDGAPFATDRILCWTEGHI